MSPTARSLRYLRERGYMVAVVERWNPGARVRQDLYGFADILAVKPLEQERARPILAVQVCTVGDQAKRIAKLTGEAVGPNVARWIGAGGAVEVHGWAKRGPRGKRKVWSVTVTAIPLAQAG